jgi:small-conductance mechanosensitive channel
LRSQAALVAGEDESMASDIPPNFKRLIVTPALSATFLVLLLSLATWYFFYMRSMPLSSGDIAVVVVLWLIVVIAARWIVGRVAPDRKKSRKAKKKAEIFKLPCSTVIVGDRCGCLFFGSKDSLTNRG